MSATTTNSNSSNGNSSAAHNDSGGSPRVAAAVAGVHTSNHVYVRSPEYAWVPARLLETSVSGSSSSSSGTTTTATATVSIACYKSEQDIGVTMSSTMKGTLRTTLQTVALREYPACSLPLQNVDEEGRLRTVPDMVDLPFLHEVRVDCCCVFVCAFLLQFGRCVFKNCSFIFNSP